CAGRANPPAKRNAAVPSVGRARSRALPVAGQVQSSADPSARSTQSGQLENRLSSTTGEHSMRPADAPFNSAKTAQMPAAECVDDAAHVLCPVAWTDQYRI